MPLVFNDFPVGRGFVVLAPFSAGSVSAVVFVAVLPPKKIQAPKSAEGAAKHGDAGGAGDGAASRGLIYRHCARHTPVITA